MTRKAVEDSTFETVREIISAVTKMSPEVIKLDSPVTGLMNVDSIVLLEIVVKVEQAFDIEISEAELFEIDTIRSFVETCRRLAVGGTSG